MSKTAVIRCVLSLILIGYVVFALIWADSMAAKEICTGIDVHVLQSPTSRNFVTPAEISSLLKEWKLNRTDMPLHTIDTQKIEDSLESIDNIEHANVERLADKRLLLTVTPMQPVARIFDNHGSSYYINRQGKRLTANARFRLDVPVITGAFDSVRTPVSLLPLINRIASDSSWNAIVSHVAVEAGSHDVLLVPMIRGHVINLGEPDNIDDKLERVMLMYHKVMPIKGWNYYDTISVKWRGQIVATRREKSLPEPLIRFDRADDEIYDEDVNSMLTSVDTDSVKTINN